MKSAFLKCWLGVSLLSLLTGCGTPVANADLPGTYLADYGFATETLCVTVDGRFTQSIKVKESGKVATASGTWRFKQEAQRIVFDEKLMVVMNGFGEFNPDFERPSAAIKIYPVRRSFGKLPIRVDPATPYKKQANGNTT